MLIQVLQEDIDNAGAGSYRCPIAKAIARITGQLVSVSFMGVFYWNYTDNLKGKRAKLPNEASFFVIAFDAGKEVKPFSFELDL